MLFTHFFWDFDGTLYDTYPRILRAFQKALRDVGITADDDEVMREIKQTLRIGANDYAARQGHVTGEDIMRAYHLHAEEEGRDTMRPYPGLENTLRAAIARGGKHYLYTHRGSKTSFDALRHDGLYDLFTDFITGDDRQFPPKPAPDALLAMMEKHTLDPKACVMLGDRDIDLGSGVSAGMAGALFDPDGYFPDYQADFRFADMDEVRRILIEGA